MRKWSWVMVAVLLAAAALVVACPPEAGEHAAPVLYGAASAPGAPAAAPTLSNAPQPPAASKGDKTTREIVLEHADRAFYDNKAKEWELTGAVAMRHEDGVLRAQNMRLNTETKKGSASGDLSFTDKETVITATRLEIDFDAREVVFKGDVRLVTEKKVARPDSSGRHPGPQGLGAEGEKGKAVTGGARAPRSTAVGANSSSPPQPAPSTGSGQALSGAKGQASVVTRDAVTPEGGGAPGAGGQETKEEEKPFRERSYERTEIRCPELAYNYHDHLATARNGVTARQKDRSGRADAATYNDKDELLVLTGNVEMKDEKGQTFRANKITISIAQDWLEAEGVGSSRFLVEEEEQGKAEKPQETAPPPGGEKPAPPAQTAK